MTMSTTHASHRAISFHLLRKLSFIGCLIFPFLLIGCTTAKQARPAGVAYDDLSTVSEAEISIQRNKLTGQVTPLVQPQFESILIIVPTVDAERKHGWPNGQRSKSIDMTAYTLYSNHLCFAEAIRNRRLFKTTQIITTDEVQSYRAADYEFAFRLIAHSWVLEHTNTRQQTDVHGRNMWVLDVNGLMHILENFELKAMKLAGRFRDSVAQKPASPLVTCDLRVVRVADASVQASATGQASSDKLGDLGRTLAGKLKEGSLPKGESLAVVSFRNRSETPIGKTLADELADKVTGGLVETGWFQVKERINLRAVLDERVLESADIVKSSHVQEKLAGIKYIVIGGVTAMESPK